MMRKKLTAKRIESGYSQRALALRLGCSNTHLSNIERGAMDGTIDFWRKIQGALNISDAEMWEIINEGGGG